LRVRLAGKSHRAAEEGRRRQRQLELECLRDAERGFGFEFHEVAARRWEVEMDRR